MGCPGCGVNQTGERMAGELFAQRQVALPALGPNGAKLCQDGWRAPDCAAAVAAAVKNLLSVFRHPTGTNYTTSRKRLATGEFWIWSQTDLDDPTRLRLAGIFWRLAQVASYFCKIAFLIPHQIQAAHLRFLTYRDAKGLSEEDALRAMVRATQRRHCRSPRATMLHEQHYVSLPRKLHCYCRALSDHSFRLL